MPARWDFVGHSPKALSIPAIRKNMNRNLSELYKILALGSIVQAMMD